MAGRHFLFVPGPTNVPDRVLRAMVVPMEDHRSPKFPELTLPLFQDLKHLSCVPSPIGIRIALFGFKSRPIGRGGEFHGERFIGRSNRSGEDA